MSGTPKPAAAPTDFAGAGAIVPRGAADSPVFFERVPLLRCFADALHRGVRLQKHVYKEDGAFHIAEAGTYRGRGLLALLQTARSLDVKVHITGLDSFGGFPSLSERDTADAPPNAPWLVKRIFADTTRREVEAFLGSEYFGQFTLVEGFFSETLPKLPERRYLFVVIDCDLYSSHIDCMSYFYQRLLPHGVMFFDDYHSVHYPMARKAIDEFLSDKREKLFQLNYGPAAENSMKTYIVKSESGR